MTIRVTARNVKRKWRHCDTRRSRVSQLTHLSLTCCAVTRMVILHSFCNMVRIFKWNCAFFVRKPSPVEKRLTVQNVTRLSQRSKIQTILQWVLEHLISIQYFAAHSNYLMIISDDNGQSNFALQIHRPLSKDGAKWIVFKYEEVTPVHCSQGLPKTVLPSSSQKDSCSANLLTTTWPVQKHWLP